MTPPYSPAEETDSFPEHARPQPRAEPEEANPLPQHPTDKKTAQPTSSPDPYSAPARGPALRQPGAPSLLSPSLPAQPGWQERTA
jgi:hypothetical protein